MDVIFCYLKPVLDWVPFLIFIGLLVYFMKKGPFKRQSEYMAFARQYYSDHLEETRKLNANLARIADALEKGKI